MRKIKLGEVLDVKRGTSLSGKFYKAEGDYIRLTLGNFNYPSSGWKENKSKDNLYYDGPITSEYIMSKGDIITPLTEQVRGLLGNTATVPEDNLYIQSGDIGKVIPRSDVLSGRFAYYLLSSRIVKKQLDACAQQTKIRHTSPDKIKDCVAFIPDEISKQIKIASILDAINSKIKLNNRINDNLQQLATTFYDFWFAAKNPNDKLSSILLENQKSSVQANQVNDISGDFPFFTSGDAIKESNTYIVDGLNCYMSTGGIATIKTYFGKASYSTHTWCIYGKPGYTAFLYFFLKSIISCINESYFAGSGLKHLQKEALLKIKLYIPSTEEISKFNNIIEPLLKKSSWLMQENQKLIKIRDFLLPLLMNGQATVD